jgi:hypothetical protein
MHSIASEKKTVCPLLTKRLTRVLLVANASAYPPEMYRRSTRAPSKPQTALICILYFSIKIGNQSSEDRSYQWVIESPPNYCKNLTYLYASHSHEERTSAPPVKLSGQSGCATNPPANQCNCRRGLARSLNFTISIIVGRRPDFDQYFFRRVICSFTYV